MPLKPALWLTGILLLMAGAPLPAARYPAVIDTSYKGAYRDSYLRQYDRVRLLVRQAQLEVSARLGLIQYREGFQYPLTIRFEDDAPSGLESALAYVRLSSGGDLGFSQELVINVGYSNESGMDFDRIFYHEMTHATLNDAVGGNAAIRIAPWLQEGLAQWVSGEGPGRVLSAAQTVKRSQADDLLYDLRETVQARAYPQYYLAVQYLNDRHSNSVEAIVRSLIAGKPMGFAMEDATGLTSTRFYENVRAYSLEKFQDKALPDY